MYSNTVNCYCCNKPLPIDNTLLIPLAELDDTVKVNSKEKVHVCENCYFSLDFVDEDEDFFADDDDFFDE